MHHFDRVPDESAWQGYLNDFDVRDLHGRFFGKSHEQVQEYFGDGTSISRMDALMFAPRPVFQYYVQSFAMYVLSPAAAGDSATASAFLSLLNRGRTLAASKRFTRSLRSASILSRPTKNTSTRSSTSTAASRSSA